jgi:hypothetical protein
MRVARHFDTIFSVDNDTALTFRRFFLVRRRFIFDDDATFGGD